VLLAVSCAALGVSAVITLRVYLTDGVDARLVANGGELAASLEHQAGSSGGPVPFYDAGAADTRHQSPGTFGARLLNGTITDAAIVRPGNNTSVSLTAADRAVIAALPADSHCHTVELSAYGKYRMSATPGRDGDVLVTGLPLHNVDQAAERLILVEAVVFGAALVVAGAAGRSGCGGRCGR